MDPKEAQLAIRLGADALGLVGKMPSGPGVISDGQIARIARSVPPPIATFLLTSEQSVDAIVAHHARVHTSTIQIVDKILHGSLSELRDRLPGTKLVHVIHVVGPESVDEAVLVSNEVDALLLDSGKPGKPVKELGGTGRVHDWSISRTIRDAVTIPVFLAGGLRPDNVREAISQVEPFGVDVCSGVRTNDVLDRAKLEAFIEAAKARPVPHEKQ
jgi:phosphoribosylanthranilate isomerase